MPASVTKTLKFWTSKAAILLSAFLLSRSLEQIIPPADPLILAILSFVALFITVAIDLTKVEK